MLATIEIVDCIFFDGAERNENASPFLLSPTVQHRIDTIIQVWPVELHMVHWLT